MYKIVLNQKSIIAIKMTLQFENFGQQGLYVTRVALCRLEELFEGPVVPKKSQYHMVSCSWALLIITAKLNIWSFVQPYLVLNSNTIVDLCLPFRDPGGKKIYIGRYIMHRGRVLGIRLCGEQMGMFSGWSRHKLIEVRLKMGGQEQKVNVGQFSCRCLNARIGLLFGCQILRMGNEYSNYGFDLLALVHLTQPIAQINQKVRQLSLRNVSIQCGPAQRLEVISKQQLVVLSEGSIPQRYKNTIKVGYYSLDNIFASKGYYQLSQHQKIDIKEISIEMFFNTKLSQNLPYFQHPLFHLIPDTMISFIARKQLPSQVRLYLGRLLDLLNFSRSHKIILVLDQSPSSLCFLLAIKTISETKLMPQKVLHSIFTVLYVYSDLLELLLKRINIFNLSILVPVSSENYGSIQGMFLDQFDRINLQGQKHVPVIGNSKALRAVVDLINKRQKNPLCSWLLCPFFSPHQLQTLIYSQRLRQFLNCQDLLQSAKQFLQKQQMTEQLNRSFGNLIDLTMNKCQLDIFFEKKSVQGLLRTHSPITYRFQEWLSHMQIEEEREEGELLFHYLVREIAQLVPSFYNQCSFVQQLISIPQHLIPQLLQLFLPQFVDTRLLFQQKCIIRQNTYSKITQKGQKLYCLSCKKSFPVSLVYQCQKCNNQYCFECLKQKYGYQIQYLLKKRNKSIQSLTIDSCHHCSHQFKQERDQPLGQWLRMGENSHLEMEVQHSIYKPWLRQGQQDESTNLKPAAKSLRLPHNND